MWSCGGATAGGVRQLLAQTRDQVMVVGPSPGRTVLRIVRRLGAIWAVRWRGREFV
jgi:hypothetical protein